MDMKVVKAAGSVHYINITPSSKLFLRHSSVKSQLDIGRRDTKPAPFQCWRALVKHPLCVVVVIARACNGDANFRPSGGYNTNTAATSVATSLNVFLVTRVGNRHNDDYCSG
jgi:hypothetical protein